MVRHLIVASLFVCVLFGGLTASAQQALAGPHTQPVSAAVAAESLNALDEEAGSSSGQATTNDNGPAGIIPMTRGFNFSMGTTSQHDSASGWSSLLTPNVAYRFNPHFSFNVGVPVISYININEVISTKGTGTKKVTTYGLASEHFLLGDTALAGAFETHTGLLDYNVTATMAVPTGDDARGLGAGQVTWNVNNHFERALTDMITPDIELGIGDSPNLVDARVRKSYTTTGKNAHFQVGFNVSLPRNISFTSEAYEELPLSVQTVTSVTTNGKKGAQLKTITTTTSKSLGEDNGFLNTLDIPLNPHVTLSGFYNRSLRNKIDTAGFTFTFLLRGNRPVPEGPR